MRFTSTSSLKNRADISPAKCNVGLTAHDNNRRFAGGSSLSGGKFEANWNHKDTKTQRRPALMLFSAGLLCVFVSLWFSSEQELQGQLHDPRIIGCYRLPKRLAGEAGARVHGIHVVRRVERLGTELQ